jgi:hypothetical protein
MLRKPTQKRFSTLAKAAPFAAAIMVATSLPAAAEVFDLGSDFTISGGNSPTTFSDTVALTPGTTSLDGGLLNLTISIVPVGDAAQDEWIVLTYKTARGPLSQPDEDWSMDPIGLPAAVAANFTGAFYQFLNVDGQPIDQTNHIFNQTLMSNPIPGGAGNGEGTVGFVDPIGGPGALPDLGAFSDPFSIVTNAEGTTGVDGFVQALEFAPVVPVTTTGVPEPFTLSLFGAGLAGAAAMRRRKKKA